MWAPVGRTDKMSRPTLSPSNEITDALFMRRLVFWGDPGRLNNSPGWFSRPVVPSSTCSKIMLLKHFCVCLWVFLLFAFFQMFWKTCEKQSHKNMSVCVTREMSVCGKTREVLPSVQEGCSSRVFVWLKVVRESIVFRFFVGIL